MKKRSLLKIQSMMQLMLLMFWGLGIFVSIKRLEAVRNQEGIYYNQARLLTADKVELLKQGRQDGEFREETYKKKLAEKFSNNKSMMDSYPVVVVDLTGEVLFSEKEEFKKGELVNINEIVQQDQSFFQKEDQTVKIAFSMMEEKRVWGFAIFYVDKVLLGEKGKALEIFHIFLPVIGSMAVSFFIFCIFEFYTKKRVIQPVEEMVCSSKAIIEGNYQVAVLGAKSGKLMSNDIERLSYNFELMRDELKARTEREEWLKRSQKELMSCISHDFKTPIAIIKAYGEGIRDGIYGKDEEKIKKFASIIVSKTEILTKMLGDLMEHFHAELNRLEIIKSEQYTKAFFDGLALELKQLAENYGMEFIYKNTAPDLVLNYDESRLSQVFSNLVENSIKYGKGEKGRIEFGIEVQEEKNCLLIKVSDNGKGIDRADIPFVFDKFYRGEKSRNTRIPGQGLGLSICKYIIEHHGGEISLESRKGEGATFFVTLPL